VYSLSKKTKIWEGLLDLTDVKHGREDPAKLLFCSDDSLSLFARSKSMKGVTQYSLIDGAVITESEKLHTQSIL